MIHYIPVEFLMKKQILRMIGFFFTFIKTCDRIYKRQFMVMALSIHPNSSWGHDFIYGKDDRSLGKQVQ